MESAPLGCVNVIVQFECINNGETDNLKKQPNGQERIRQQQRRAPVLLNVNLLAEWMKGVDKNKNGKADKREGKDIAHKKPLSKGGKTKTV